MHLLQALVICILFLLVTSNYILFDEYNAKSFGDMFDFFTMDDPTHGVVNYVNRETAISERLFQIKNGSIYIGVDTKNEILTGGRNSLRLHSKAIYNHGLFVLNLTHLPGSVCATWPAHWFLGRHDKWPNKGEINVIEGVHTETYNLISLHTLDGCIMNASSKSFTGSSLSNNCYYKASGQHFNQGCSIKATTNDTYGDGFNRAKGGLYVTDWSSDSVRVWLFRHDQVPKDLVEGRPNPDKWKQLPMGKFAGDCDIDKKFKDMGIIFDITFCGDWADAVWREQCGHKGPSCADFVRSNPQAFVETYWLINSLRVYQNPSTLPRWNSTKGCQNWNGYCTKEEHCFSSLKYRSRCTDGSGTVCCLPNSDDICLQFKCDKIHRCLTDSSTTSSKSLDCLMLKHCALDSPAYKSICNTSLSDLELTCCAPLPKIRKDLFGVIKRVEKEQRCEYVEVSSTSALLAKLCIIGVSILVCLITLGVFAGMRLSNVREASQFYQPRMPQFNDQNTRLTNLSNPSK